MIKTMKAVKNRLRRQQKNGNGTIGEEKKHEVQLHLVASKFDKC